MYMLLERVAVPVGGSSDDPGAAQASDLVRADAQHRENLVGVLAQFRCQTVWRDRGVADADQAGQLADMATLRVRQFGGPTRTAVLWI
jgi:hypothetical protein